MQYASHLNDYGFDIDYSFFFCDEYVKKLYKKQKSKKLVLDAYIRRVAKLIDLYKYDVIWLEKEIFPFFPEIVERLLRWMNIPYVVDFDDAWFHRYDQHKNNVLRFLFREKIDRVMRNAHTVVVGNEYLANRAYNAGALKVVEVPTVVDLNRYQIIDSVCEKSNSFTVGWIGNPQTFLYLKPLMKIFSSLSEIYGIKFIAIGVKNENVENTVFDAFDWSEETEVDILRGIDIGIMPLDDDLWQKGKCGYKLIQYMALGKPVIASPVGVNAEIVIDGFNGFLSSTVAEWNSGILEMFKNQRKRKEMGCNARRTVEMRYNLRVQVPRIIELFESVL